MLYCTVLYCAVLCTVQYCTVQYSTEQYSTVQHSTSFVMTGRGACSTHGRNIIHLVKKMKLSVHLYHCLLKQLSLRRIVCIKSHTNFHSDAFRHLLAPSCLLNRMAVLCKEHRNDYKRLLSNKQSSLASVKTSN